MKTCAFQKTYQGTCVLSFPSFEFQPGKVYALIGANGSGKSTFAKIISGILPADQQVVPFGNSIPAVGYLPQKPYAFRMSLKKNVLLNACGTKEDRLTRADALLHSLELTALSNKKAATLSGGEAARMFLARLCMRDYAMLVLDEPCAAMDIAATLHAEELIREYIERTQAAVILITHSLQQARRLSDEVLFFHEGKLIEAGETQRVLSHPLQKETRDFLEFFC